MTAADPGRYGQLELFELTEAICDTAKRIAEGEIVTAEDKLDLAEQMWEARKRMPADQEFGAWWQTTGIGYSRQWRAILLRAGERIAKEGRPGVNLVDTGGEFSIKQYANALRISGATSAHPARYSEPLLAIFAGWLDGYHRVLDPFAGTGRIHELTDHDTVGVEIEPEWAEMHEQTVHANAMDLPFDDGSFDAICTSPTYGNRMADHHEARDDSFRGTYKHTLGRDLHPDNTGQMQWGEDYRTLHQRAWDEADRVLRPGGRFVLNIKNHIRDGEIQRVAEWHINWLVEYGMRLAGIDVVPTRGLSVAVGENLDKRLAHELVVVLDKEDE